MNTDIVNYHTSFMPALRLENPDSAVAALPQVPHPHKYPQADLNMRLRDLIEQVDNTERGRLAIIDLMTALDHWNTLYQISRGY